MSTTKITSWLVVGGIGLSILSACQTHVTRIDVRKPLPLNASSTRHAKAEFQYATKSEVKVFDKKQKTRQYTEFASFDIYRETLHVSENAEMQFKINTANKKGNMSLNDMGFPEPNETLYEVIDQLGSPVVVKDHPMGSVFYLPRVSLPQNPVKEGDKWQYRGSWISQNTGWPFEIEILSKLTAWGDCDGSLCAVIDFTAQIVLPDDFPLKGQIRSNIKGRLHYSPHSFEVLWGESQSDEIFSITELQKEIRVKSFSCSYKKGYSKICPEID